MCLVAQISISATRSDAQQGGQLFEHPLAEHIKTVPDIKLLADKILLLKITAIP